MILIDANLLVYAHVTSMPQHQTAVSWLDRKLNGSAIVAMPWQSLLSFARLVTNPRLFQRPLPVTKAWAQIEHWLNCPVVRIPNPGDRYRDILTRLLLSSVDRSHLIPDAQLAALAIENGFVLCSSDRDFARFSELRWENPLVQR
jgi:toxin-antitoxin system PIN domain toxin